MLRSRLLVTIGLGVLAGIAIGVFVATILPLSGDDVAAQVTPSIESESPTASQAQPVAFAGGPSESIKVHGKWTLEVRDPDGTVVSARVFQNALSAFSGKNLLSSVLAGNITVMGWRIAVESFTSGQDLCFNDGNPTDCFISASDDPRFTRGDQNFFPTLTVTGDSGHTGTGELLLTGSFTAEATGVIDRVTTSIRYGTGPEAYSFTVKSITPESVSAGQTVGVTVEVTFE